MAKDKSKSGVPNKHLHARISYLQQAATYLSLQQQRSTPEKVSADSTKATDGVEQNIVNDAKPQKMQSNAQATACPESGAQPMASASTSVPNGLPTYLTSHLTQVARKSQIRLHPTIKHSVCKRCSNTLIEGTTSKKFMDNLSKGGRKPHADVLFIECGFCGMQKRFPVGQQRQKRKNERVAFKDGAEAALPEG